MTTLPDRPGPRRTAAERAAVPSAANPVPPAGVPPTPVGPFLTGPHVGYGIIVHMYYQDHRRILDAVQDLGFTWIKQQVQWKDIEGSPGAYAWGELDRIVGRHGSARRCTSCSAWSSRRPGPPAAAQGFPDRPRTTGQLHAGAWPRTIAARSRPTKSGTSRT